MNGRAKMISGGRGYILVETVVALVLLAIGSYAVHGTIRQAIVTRGQAQDYTQARFLLEELMGGIELQPLIKEETRSGRYDGVMDRFRWEYQIRKIDLPLPPPPAEPNPNWPPEKRFEYSVKFLAHVRATVSWERSGERYLESAETLFNPSKMWLPRPKSP